MTKKEFISQLTICASSYADERLGDNNKLFASNQYLREQRDSWEQKYHSAMTANKKLDEQSEGLQVEKQALLDVIFEWKNDNLSLTALNATLSEELQELKELCASQYQDFLKQETSSQNWQGNYYAMQKLKNSLAKELDDAKAKLEEAYKVGNRWFEESKELTFNCKLLKEELIEERGRHEEFQKKSHGILATLEENLQKKQETIEALTGWKEGAESALGTMEEELKDAKDVIHTQENTIEWLDGRVRRLKEKKAKKEQND